MHNTFAQYICMYTYVHLVCACVHKSKIYIYICTPVQALRYTYVYVQSKASYTQCITRNTHAQWALREVYASLMRPAQLCTCMSTNDILDTYNTLHTYIMRIDPSFRASCSCRCMSCANVLGNYVRMSYPGQVH